LRSGGICRGTTKKRGHNVSAAEQHAHGGAEEGVQDGGGRGRGPEEERGQSGGDQEEQARGQSLEEAERRPPRPQLPTHSAARRCVPKRRRFGKAGIALFTYLFFKIAMLNLCSFGFLVWWLFPGIFFLSETFYFDESCNIGLIYWLIDWFFFKKNISVGLICGLFGWLEKCWKREEIWI
jgi:hypothetical protein